MGFSCPALEREQWQNGNRGGIEYNFCVYTKHLKLNPDENLELLKEALKLHAAYMGAIYSPLNHAPAPHLMCNQDERCPIRERILKMKSTSTE